ncbi:efflux RND transporter periplasmic adaptor subunit [Roseomonas eburnea]|uniref:Efflux RND transporter periplasmic adaptor subunit n=1 Tax=Neoroseomonas eburnea TaxID=1346889 RepID=A0A9X9XBY8_9PROT|nr:efflux RND transporter periplasmic adaptor subunit [Neoroseomonas eburnea]MBR0681224.1 efflux RND transporter periplasmic adaptor subunit [Neoroseomonas eburnea]
MRPLLPFLLLMSLPAAAETRLTVMPQTVADERPVFATVESVREVEARARIAGTLAALSVREGDSVAAGQVIARVEDAKHPPQLAAIDARLAALAAQRRQAAQELERTRALRASGTATQARLDDAQTALDVVEGQIAAAQAERAVTAQQQEEGAVLAPQAGRVLRVRGTAGAVVMPGEAIATLATDRYVLRLRLPERHARFLREGDPVTLGARGLSGGTPLGRGRVRLVYPELQQGQVVADAEVEGLGDFFVGERVRVTIAADLRQAIVIPHAFLIAGAGVDLVRLESGALVPVQRGPVRGEEVEILSGLAAGDVLVRP